jgi:site-specific DNA recombinase
VRIATYERVSSDDQRERETIKTQQEAISHWLASRPDVLLIERFCDDGVSGTIPLAQRPAGRRLVELAARHGFDAIVMTRPDRLGRDAIDLMQARALFESLGIELIGVVEPMDDEFSFDVRAVFAKHDRKRFLRLSREGTERAVREGRYVGGISLLGYCADGPRHRAFWALDDQRVVWRDWTPVDIVRFIYQRIGIDGCSCHRVARELNAMGVPTHYTMDGRLVGGRGKRKEQTTNVWRPNRVLKIAQSTMPRGLVQFRKRSNLPVIEGPCPRVVSDELWHATQEVIQGKRRWTDSSSKRTYMLSGLLHCACGSNYSGTPGQAHYGDRYRCNGANRFRGPAEERCTSKAVPARLLEPLVWGEVEAFLRAPGDVLSAVLDQTDDGGRERLQLALEGARSAVARNRKRLTEYATMRADGDLSPDEYRSLRATAEHEIIAVSTESSRLEAELAALERAPKETLDLLPTLIARVDEGFDLSERQLIVRHLVDHIDVEMIVGESGAPVARCVVHFRFPEPCAVADSTGKGCTPPSTRSSRGTRPKGAPG